jgi:hypothetical protein
LGVETMALQRISIAPLMTISILLTFASIFCPTFVRATENAVKIETDTTITISNPLEIAVASSSSCVYQGLDFGVLALNSSDYMFATSNSHFTWFVCEF